MNLLATSDIEVWPDFTLSTFHFTTVGPLNPRRQVLLSQVAVISVDVVWVTDIGYFFGVGLTSVGTFGGSGGATQTGSPLPSSCRLYFPQTAVSFWTVA